MRLHSSIAAHHATALSRLCAAQRPSAAHRTVHSTAQHHTAQRNACRSSWGACAQVAGGGTRAFAGDIRAQVSCCTGARRCGGRALSWGKSPGLPRTCVVMRPSVCWKGGLASAVAVPRAESARLRWHHIDQAGPRAATAEFHVPPGPARHRSSCVVPSEPVRGALLPNKPRDPLAANHAARSPPSMPCSRRLCSW